MQRKRELWSVVLLVLGSSCLGFGQAVNANLVGTVTDPSKAAVPGATVTITEIKGGATKSTQTNESGNFDFEALQPGMYDIVAGQSGFKQAKIENRVLLVNTTMRVDVTLEIGAATESITISSAPRSSENGPCGRRDRHLVSAGRGSAPDEIGVSGG